MNLIISYLIELMIDKEIILENEQDEYRYGLERIGNKIMCYSELLILAIIFKKVSESIIFICFFLFLRRRTGGYHMPTDLMCMIGTNFIYCVVVMCIMPLLQGRKILVTLLMCASAIAIFALAPINHPNLNFSNKELLQYRKRSRIALGIEVIIILGFKFIDVMEIYCTSAILGIVLCAFLLCLSKITKQEVQIDEKSGANFASN